MDQIYFDNAQKELKKAAETKDHPFRYFTLATTGINYTPRLRTVVLREVNKNLRLTVYTDTRSRKVTHIKENNNVCLLFFDHAKLLQLKIDGVAYMETEPKKIEKHWKELKEEAKHDYTSSEGPGTKILSPKAVDYLNTSHHFGMMHIEPYKIEYLQLKKPNHLRILYALEDNEKWVGNFMIP